MDKIFVIANSLKVNWVEPFKVIGFVATMHPITEGNPPFLKYSFLMLFPSAWVVVDGLKSNSLQAKWPMESALIISYFCSVKRTRVLTSPGRDTNPSQVSSHKVWSHKYSNLDIAGIELGTLWSEGRDLTNCANHSVGHLIKMQSNEQLCQWRYRVAALGFPLQIIITNKV